ncbi:endonuclease III [Candidatus Micrarchaeota archaeon CG_4_10_14_0_2_um_filter_55_9]|nr:MAG: endonuclease III [Candidatus Micrarchaeota archaeon CG1_02_55_41]PIO02774.1 MAG: endonuclease III [Candidatus Micrarchaeota archaeon CG09_land_8_20_14_0_10_55_25]PIZ91907.1 MAG: endonuclease III [Candidatus Micrarchaeota archaeon CG_4_10_14_0_2_um_filter_55_9]PJD01084.1 MAG: endonuclease III [Candidatus Micrarchaeota archaeon CG10_big_fil_rev_8_21_14_0_10_54_18]
MYSIICGLDAFGRKLLEGLLKKGHEVVAVEKNEELALEVHAETNAVVINGDPTSPIVLEQTGVSKADVLIANMPTDVENLALCVLVTTILSAQCTDAQVDKVAPQLFKRFPTPEKLAEARQIELEKIIRSTGYYKAKARHLKAAARMLVNEFNGVVPNSMDELMKLPGVGRKTANIILEHAYNLTQGIAVDTHVWRVSRRLGLSDKNTQRGIENDLMRAYPRRDWHKINYLFISHGRAVCRARKPECGKCVLRVPAPII